MDRERLLLFLLVFGLIGNALAQETEYQEDDYNERNEEVPATTTQAPQENEDSQDYYGRDDNTEVQSESCHEGNGEFYFANEKHLINKQVFVNGYYQSDKDELIQTNAIKIQSLAYDYKHKEVLYVHSRKLDTVVGIRLFYAPHPVVQQKSIHFNQIVGDPVTGNLYFADDRRGIGVCVSHGTSNINCTILVLKTNPNVTGYTDLTLDPYKGHMAWIEKSHKSEVKLASMNGKHVRTFSKFDNVKSIAIDTQFSNLYVGLYNGTIHRLTLSTHASLELETRPFNKLYILGCVLRSFEKDHFNEENIDKLTLKSVPHSRGFSVNVNIGYVPSFLVLESDNSPKENPCETFDCDGICVLDEHHYSPKPYCVLIMITERMVEKLNPISGALILLTVMLTLFLICSLVMNFNPSFNSFVRNQFNRLRPQNLPSVHFSNPLNQAHVL